MIKKLIVVAALAACLIIPFTVGAAEVGVGYNVQTEGITALNDAKDAHLMQGLSVRAWFDKIGVEGNFMWPKDDGLMAYSAKTMYAPYVTDKVKGYIGGTVLDIEPDDSFLTRDEENALAYGPFIGIEFRPVSDLGLNFDIAWLFQEDKDVGVTDVGMEEISFAFGAHYYF